MKKVIFLDRDGTLIVNKHYLNNTDDIEYLPGVFEALELLKSLGYEFVMVTNQSGIPRGLITEEQLENIHNVMKKDFFKHGIEFLEIYHAPYMPESNHPDRKPNPGMLLKARDTFNIDMTASYIFGDSKADWGAGINAKVTPIIIGEDFQNEIDPNQGHFFESWSEIKSFFQSQTDS